MNTAAIYEPPFQQRLFDEMSATYGLVNIVASLGFAVRWRRQCLKQAELAPGMVVCDLMSGMGECKRDGYGVCFATQANFNRCRRASACCSQYIYISPSRIIPGVARCLRTLAYAKQASADSVLACVFLDDENIPETFWSMPISSSVYVWQEET